MNSPCFCMHGNLFGDCCGRNKETQMALEELISNGQMTRRRNDNGEWEYFVREPN